MAKAEYRSAIRSRKLIKEAFADLLQEKPLDKITVTDIINHAGINRGTFYAHYADIPDLIHHLIDEMFSRIREAIPEKPGDLAEIPILLLQRVQSILEEDLDFYRKVMSSSASTLLQESLVSIILDYMLHQEQLFPSLAYEQYAFSIRFCAGGMSNLYRDWFAGKLPISLDELTFQSTALLRNIIANTLAV